MTDSEIADTNTLQQSKHTSCSRYLMFNHNHKKCAATVPQSVFILIYTILHLSAWNVTMLVEKPGGTLCQRSTNHVMRFHRKPQRFSYLCCVAAPPFASAFGLGHVFFASGYGRGLFPQCVFKSPFVDGTFLEGQSFVSLDWLSLRHVFFVLSLSPPLSLVLSFAG